MQPEVERLNRRYFALLREAGITDRRAFQRGLYERFLIGSESCKQWSPWDYAVAINAVEECIANADAA